jgi:hypothetical protein
MVREEIVPATWTDHPRTYQRREFNDLHDRICHDPLPDDRYSSRLSNQDKVAYICKALAYPEEVFDVEVPFPIEDWYHSDDAGLVNSGLYICDLRSQFYLAILGLKGEKAAGEMWLKHAESEYWQNTFNALAARKMHGIVMIDTRELH